MLLSVKWISNDLKEYFWKKSIYTIGTEIILATHHVGSIQ